MDKYEIFFTEKFEKDFNKLSEQNKNAALERIEILKNNSRYQTVKVKGKKNLYRTRVNDSIRLFWRFRGRKIIVMFCVGHHDVEKPKRLRRI